MRAKELVDGRLGAAADWAIVSRIAYRYAWCMAQLVTRINEDLAVLVDELIADGIVDSRSDAVRKGLDMLIDQHRRMKIAAAIVAGYERQPQTVGGVGWSDEATAKMIGDEPW